MGIHCELRDKFGSVVKNEPFVYLLEGLSAAVFEDLQESPAWQQLQALTQHLAALHDQEMQLTLELADALSKQSSVQEGCQLRADLLASNSASVLQQDANAPCTPPADPVEWLRWWRDPRSWSAGYTFCQWLQDNAAGAGLSQPFRSASSAAPRLIGPRPANVAQAVLWRLQAGKFSEQACEAAGAAVLSIQARLSKVQQREKDGFAQLKQLWVQVLQGSSLSLSSLKQLQQDRKDSEAQLAAALQDAAAARARAEAAELAFQQQQQHALAERLAHQQRSLVVHVTMQEPAIVLDLNIQACQENEQQQQRQLLRKLQQRLAVLEVATAAALQDVQARQHQQPQQQEVAIKQQALQHTGQQQQQQADHALRVSAAHAGGGCLEQQPTTPACSGLSGQQRGPLPNLPTSHSPGTSHIHTSSLPLRGSSCRASDALPSAEQVAAGKGGDHVPAPVTDVQDSRSDLTPLDAPHHPSIGSTAGSSAQSGAIGNGSNSNMAAVGGAACGVSFGMDRADSRKAARSSSSSLWGRDQASLAAPTAVKVVPGTFSLADALAARAGRRGGSTMPSSPGGGSW